jgi:hypothetical protein
MICENGSAGQVTFLADLHWTERGRGQTFSKSYLGTDWHQAATCVCKTRKRHAIHLRISGPDISLKAPQPAVGDRVGSGVRRLLFVVLAFFVLGRLRNARCVLADGDLPQPKREGRQERGQ